MNTETDDEVELRYLVESVEPCEPPSGMPPGEWYRYIIGQGMSKIEGLRPGSIHEVRNHAEEVAQGLNERVNKNVSAYAARKKK